MERQDADLEETAFDIFEAEGRYDDAITLLEPAIERLKRFGDSGALAMCLSSLAGIYDDTGRYEDALQLHFQALETARRCEAGYAQVNAAIQMMWGLRHAERSLEALRICEEALALGAYSNTEYLRNALGALLMHLGRLEESVSVYEHNARHGNVSTKTLAWGRLANLYAELGRLETRVTRRRNRWRTRCAPRFRSRRCVPRLPCCGSAATRKWRSSCHSLKGVAIPISPRKPNSKPPSSGVHAMDAQRKAPLEKRRRCDVPSGDKVLNYFPAVMRASAF
ncbi:MAG: tetratricopeptide repeat protein [Pleurocapsa sp. SU_196_0]|nr:tetratricopeptide repeat protein [Pleurocapsa sp. SU_196_0]